MCVCVFVCVCEEREGVIAHTESMIQELQIGRIAARMAADLKTSYNVGYVLIHNSLGREEGRKGGSERERKSE
jgi:hypothetical protein